MTTTTTTTTTLVGGGGEPICSRSRRSWARLSRRRGVLLVAPPPRSLRRLHAVAAVATSFSSLAVPRRAAGFAPPPPPPLRPSFAVRISGKAAVSSSSSRRNRGDGRLWGAAFFDAAGENENGEGGEEDEEEEEGLFYDDFGDMVFGSSSSSSSSFEPPPAESFDDFGTPLGDEASAPSLFSSSSQWDSLASRIAETREREVKRDARLAKNWRTGNWNVRGFALDGVDPMAEAAAGLAAMGGGSGGDESGARTSSAPRLEGSGPSSPSSGAVVPEPPDAPPPSTPPPSPAAAIGGGPVRVSRISADLLESGSGAGIVAVGRTDGTVVLVRLGTEYLTKFAAVPKLVVDDDGDGWGSEASNQQTSSDENSPGGNGPTFRVESELTNPDDVRNRMREEIRNLRDVQASFTEDPFDALYGGGAGMPPPSAEEEAIAAPEEPQQHGSPFRILHQFRAHDPSEGPVSALLYHGDRVYASGSNSGGEIRVWEVPDDEVIATNDGQEEEDEGIVGEQKKMIPLRNLSGVHSGEIVALKTLSSQGGDAEDDDAENHDLLLSASADGTFALWSLDDGDLVYACRVVDEDAADEGWGGPEQVSILCADVDTTSTTASTSSSDGSHVIYLGLSTGHVVGYVASELIQSAALGGGVCPIPSCKFAAHGDGSAGDARGVTAILCAGEGAMGLSRGASGSRGPKTSSLVTGGADGTVKQWEMMARKLPPPAPSDPSSSSSPPAVTKLEHWPRLSTQRLNRRAHLFNPSHLGPVTALASNDPSKVLSAGIDGTVRVWNPTEGTEYYRFDGFDDSTEEGMDGGGGGMGTGMGTTTGGGVSSLCLGADVLITDGMGEYVCLHDFDVEEGEAETGYELEW